MNIAKTISLVLLLMFSFASCAGPSKKPPRTAEASVRSALNKVEVQVAAGDTKNALKTLEKIVAAHPDTDIADDCYILMGDIYYKAHDFESAYKAYMGVVNSDVFSPREADALLGAAQSLFRLGRYDEALSLTDQGLKFREISQPTRVQLFQLRFAVLTQLGDRLDALRTVIFLAQNEQDETRRNQYKEKALDYVESRLSDKELLTVVNDRDFALVHGPAMFRVGMSYFEQRDFGRAKDYLSKVQRLMPDSELAERAAALTAQIDARREVSPRTVGAVLPLTGKHSYVAEKTLQGLQLGLGIFGKDRSNLRLAVVDSEGNPDTARRAVERLVTEDHVIGIVGSLLSRTAVSVASKANELGVPSIALSQRSGLTDIGDYVFRNSLTSEMQVRHLVKVAMERGMKRFAILYPNDAYGIEYANLFWDEVLARGGQITGAQPYDTKETDFSGPIRRLVGTYYLEGRQDEFRILTTEWYKKQKTISRRHEPPEDILPPIVDFDALFIPDSTKALGQIAPMLAYNNIRGVKLLGTNLWNSDSLVERGQKFVEGSLFVDSLSSSDPEYRNSAFFREYSRIFGEEPSIFAVQGYEAGLIFRQLLLSGERSRVGLKEKLQRLTNFPGAFGPLDIDNRREIHRPLVTLTVENGRVTQVPSVQTFTR